MYAKTGRVKTPSPPACSDASKEVLELSSDTGGDAVVESKGELKRRRHRLDPAKSSVVSKPVEGSSDNLHAQPELGVCRCEDKEEPVRITSSPKRAEQAESSFCPSEETLHKSDSDFHLQETSCDNQSTSTFATSEDEKLEEEVSASQEEIGNSKVCLTCNCIIEYVVEMCALCL